MGKRDNLLILQAQQQKEALKTRKETLKIQKAAMKQRSLASETLRTLLGSPLLKKALRTSLDLSRIPREWERTFADPAMDAWWRYNAPGIREEFASIPGAFYSADRARGVAQVANQYFAQSVQPQLFTALQQAKALMPQMIGAFTNPLAAMATTGVPSMPSMPSVQMPNLQKTSMGPLVGGLAGMGISGLSGAGALTPAGLSFGTLGSMIGGLFG